MPPEKHLVCFCVTFQLSNIKVHTQFSFVQELSTIWPEGFGIFVNGHVPVSSFPCSYIDWISRSLCVLPFSPHTSRDAETFLLDSKKIHSSNSGWLVFDTTATSNHWVMNPQQNLGLQLCVETADGKFECFLYSQDLCQSLGPEKRSQSTSETVQKPCMCD